ncbi:MAG: hypothetical protein Q8R16_00995, partial [bacterium]|nr:hypothetical protein [bacterium]
QVAAQAGQDVRKKVEPEVPYENLDLFGKCQWLERKCAALGKPVVNKGKLVSRGMQQVNLEKRRAAMLAQVAELERALATAPKLGPLRERRAAVLAKAVQIGRKLEGEALAALEVKDTMSDAEITGLEILLTQWEKTLLDEEKRARRQVPVKSSPVPVVSVADARDVADALRSQREQIALPTIEESSAGRVLVSLMDAGDQNGKGKSN